LEELDANIRRAMKMSEKEVKRSLAGEIFMIQGVTSYMVSNAGNSVRNSTEDIQDSHREI